MSGILGDLLETIDRLALEHGTRDVRAAAERGDFPHALWQALEDIGLPRALLPEDAGGAGVAFGDALAALKRTAAHALPVPLAETLLASRLLMAAGLDVPTGPLTVAPGQRGDRLEASGSSGALHLSGVVHRVPWGIACGHVVAVVGVAGSESVVLVKPGGAGAAGRNLAQEPRDTLRFDGQPCVADARLPGARERLLLEGALARSLQMAGALERVLDYAVQYANERIQFGRPIGKFQAVQHMLAVLAGHVAAAAAVTDAAVEASATAPDAFLVAAAKARTGEAAGRGAEIAHQVHGAMGYTQEHNLHDSTRRLWSWRDEFGNEAFWQRRLGREVVAAGADALWPRLSAT